MKRLLLWTVFFVAVGTAAADYEPRMELTIARRKIVQGDCQLLYVKFVNPTDDDVSLDGTFNIKCGGPMLELRYEAGEFAYVSDMPASVAKCGPGGTTVKAQTSKAVFMYVGFDMTRPEREMIIFSRPGKYAIRALMHRNGEPIASQPQEFEVTADDEDAVAWPGFPMHRGVLYWPKRELVSKLPLNSLLREHAELFLTMERYVDAPPSYPFDPPKEHKRWFGARKLAPPLVADAVGLQAAYRLAGRKNYALALEEISRMKALTIDAESLRARCEQELEE